MWMCGLLFTFLLWFCLYCQWWLVGFYDFFFLLFWDSIIKSHALEILNHDLVTHFLFTFFLFCTFFIFRVSNNSLSLRDLFIYGLLIEDIVSLIKIEKILLRFWFFLYFFSLNLSTIEFHFNFICKNGFVFLYNRRFVVNMTITVCDYTTFSKVFECSGIRTFLHEQKLFMIPFIQICRFHKRIDNTILSMFACTIDT